jgi:hypothetical protein
MHWVPVVFFLAAVSGHAQTHYVWEDPAEPFEKGAIEIFPGGSVVIEIELPQKVLGDHMLQLTVTGNALFARERFRMLCNINGQADFFAVPFWVYPGEGGE